MAGYVSSLLTHVRLARATRKTERHLSSAQAVIEAARENALRAHDVGVLEKDDVADDEYLPDADNPSPTDVEMILAVDRLRTVRQKVERPWKRAASTWTSSAPSRNQLQGPSLPIRSLWDKNTRKAWSQHLANLEQSLSDTTAILKSELPTQLIDEYSTFNPSAAEAASVVASYRANNAAFVAEVESLRYTPTPTDVPQSRGLSGGLPQEIAQQVEETSLETGPLLVTLRRYQEFGARYLISQERALLGDDMGLGKTVQVLAAMCHLHAIGARHFLVVVPNSVLLNWEREISKHTELTAVIAHGDEREARLHEWNDTGGVAITTYGTLNKVLHLIDHVDMVAVDEAHFVKNPVAQRTQAVAQVTQRSDYVALMTGTALENRLDELVALVLLAQPEMEKSIDQLLNDGREFVNQNQWLAGIAPVYLRRTQQDVLLELPECILVDEWLHLSDEDKHAYLNSPADVMSRRLAATHGGGISVSAKYERLLELVEIHREAGRKIAVFSFFRQVIEDVCQVVGGAASITGDVSSADRQRIIDSFASDPDQTVLVLQVDAGGVGINLQCAQVVILMEAQFKPSTEWQAIARVYRMGQSRKVIVHRLLAHDTIEERLVQLLEMKTQIFATYAHDSSVRDASEMATDTGLSIEAQLQQLLNENPQA